MLTTIHHHVHAVFAIPHVPFKMYIYTHCQSNVITEFFGCLQQPHCWNKLMCVCFLDQFINVGLVEVIYVFNAISYLPFADINKY